MAARAAGAAAGPSPRQQGPASCASKATRYPAGQDEAPAGRQTAEAKEKQCENFTRAGPSCIYSTTAKPNPDFQQTSNRRSRCRRTRTAHAGGRCGAGSCAHPKHQIPRLRARRAGRAKIPKRSPWRRCGTHSSPTCLAHSPAQVRRQNNHPPYISILQQHFAALLLHTLCRAAPIRRSHSREQSHGQSQAGAAAERPPAPVGRPRRRGCKAGGSAKQGAVCFQRGGCLCTQLGIGKARRARGPGQPAPMRTAATGGAG